MIPARTPRGSLIASARLGTNDLDETIAWWKGENVPVWGVIPERVGIAAGPEARLYREGLNEYDAVLRRAAQALKPAPLVVAATAGAWRRSRVAAKPGLRVLLYERGPDLRRHGLGNVCSSWCASRRRKIGCGRARTVLATAAPWPPPVGWECRVGTGSEGRSLHAVGNLIRVARHSSMQHLQRRPRIRGEIGGAEARPLSTRAIVQPRGLLTSIELLSAVQRHRVHDRCLHYGTTTEVRRSRSMRASRGRAVNSAGCHDWPRGGLTATRRPSEFCALLLGCARSSGEYARLANTGT